MTSVLRNWIYKAVSAFIKMDAKLVPLEQKKERLSECDNCDQRAKKKVKPYLPEVDVCNGCGGCILDIKAEMLTHMRDGEKKDKPLTPEEVADYALNRGSEKFERVIIECPLKKWENIDKKYKN